MLILASQGAQGPMGPAGPAGARGIPVSIRVPYSGTPAGAGLGHTEGYCWPPLSLIHVCLIPRALKVPEVTKENLENLEREE